MKLIETMRECGRPIKLLLMKQNYNNLKPSKKLFYNIGNGIIIPPKIKYLGNTPSIFMKLCIIN